MTDRSIIQHEGKDIGLFTFHVVRSRRVWPYRIKMYLMDFEEYLWAIQEDIIYPAIKEAFEKRKSLGDAIHRKIMKIFRTYMVIGGMPQAVEAYVDAASIRS